MNKKNKLQKKESRESGFTLIEILVVIGLIALLAAIVIIAINPARQFAQGRNTQRVSNVNAILNAVGQKLADGKGMFKGNVPGSNPAQTCPDLTLTTDTPAGTLTAGTAYEILTDDDSGVNAANIHIACLSPQYIPAMPVDPALAAGTDTGYKLIMDANHRVTIAAPNAELGQTISITR